MSIIHYCISLASRILILALLHFFPDFIVTGFRSDLLRWLHILQDEFLSFHMQYDIEIGSNCNFQVKQGSVETYLR